MHYHTLHCLQLINPMRGSRGGTGGPDSVKNHKNIAFLSNTGPNALENHKVIKLAINVGLSSARQRADDGQLIVAFDPTSPDQLKKRCQSWTPSGFADEPLGDSFDDC